MHKHWFKISVTPGTAMAVAMLALFLSLGGGGYAAQGIAFLLGQKNTATATTTLSGAVNGSVLVVKNTNKKGGPPLALLAPPGKAPFVVNSATRVTGLNADYVDGLDSTAFLRSDAAINAATLGGLVPAAFVRTTIGPWHYIGDPGEPAFQNSWDNWEVACTNVHFQSTQYQCASYRIDNNHVVHVRGYITGGTIGLPAFTLPPAACSHWTRYMPAVASGTFGDGEVRAGLDCTVTPMLGSNAWYSLEGVDFPDASSDLGALATGATEVAARPRMPFASTERIPVAAVTKP